MVKDGVPVAEEAMCGEPLLLELAFAVQYENLAGYIAFENLRVRLSCAVRFLTVSNIPDTASSIWAMFRSSSRNLDFWPGRCVRLHGPRRHCSSEYVNAERSRRSRGSRHRGAPARILLLASIIFQCAVVRDLSRCRRGSYPRDRV